MRTVHRGRPRAATTLLAAAGLALTSCTLPLVGADRIGAEDVITVRITPYGTPETLGETVIVIGPEQVTSRRDVPGGVLYEVTDDLEPAQRQTAVDAAEDLIASQRRGDDDTTICEDGSVLTLEVSGSLEHTSTADLCSDDSPQGVLASAAREVEDDRVAGLARPTDRWRFEIGADEVYETRVAFEEGIRLVPDGAEGRDLGWAGTAALLGPLNTLLLDEAAADSCPGAAEELVMTREDEPAVALRLPLCPTGPTAEIAQALRG